MGSHSLLQGIFPTQESNLGLLHWQVDSLLSESSIVKAMVFPVVMGGCESWTIKKTEHQRSDAFELWCWTRPSRTPCTQGNQSSQSQEKSTLNWKDWCWSYSSKTLASHLIGQDPDAGKNRGQEERKAMENEMVRQHHRLNGHEFEQTLGNNEGRGSLECHSPWGCRVRHDGATEQQQNNL